MARWGVYADGTWSDDWATITGTETYASAIGGTNIPIPLGSYVLSDTWTAANIGDKCKLIVGIIEQFGLTVQGKLTFQLHENGVPVGTPVDFDTSNFSLAEDAPYYPVIKFDYAYTTVAANAYSVGVKRTFTSFAYMLSDTGGSTWAVQTFDDRPPASEPGRGASAGDSLVLAARVDGWVAVNRWGTAGVAPTTYLTRSWDHPLYILDGGCHIGNNNLSGNNYLVIQSGWLIGQRGGSIEWGTSFVPLASTLTNLVRFLNTISNTSGLWFDHGFDYRFHGARSHSNEYEFFITAQDIANPSGNTIVTLAGSPTSWAVGDTIFIEPESPGEHEYAVISAIDGSDYELDRTLTYDHSVSGESQAVACEEAIVIENNQGYNYGIVIERNTYSPPLSTFDSVRIAGAQLDDIAVKIFGSDYRPRSWGHVTIHSTDSVSAKNLLYVQVGRISIDQLLLFGSTATANNEAALRLIGLTGVSVGKITIIGAKRNGVHSADCRDISIGYAHWSGLNSDDFPAACWRMNTTSAIVIADGRDHRCSRSVLYMESRCADVHINSWDVDPNGNMDEFIGSEGSEFIAVSISNSDLAGLQLFGRDYTIDQMDEDTAIASINNVNVLGFSDNETFLLTPRGIITLTGPAQADTTVTPGDKNAIKWVGAASNIFGRNPNLDLPSVQFADTTSVTMYYKAVMVSGDFTIALLDELENVLDSFRVAHPAPNWSSYHDADTFTDGMSANATTGLISSGVEVTILGSSKTQLDNTIEIDLKNITSGALLGVTYQFTGQIGNGVTTIRDSGWLGDNATYFQGYVDRRNRGIELDSADDIVTLTVRGLNTNKYYRWIIGSDRASGDTDRFVQVTLACDGNPVGLHSIDAYRVREISSKVIDWNIADAQGTVLGWERIIPHVDGSISLDFRESLQSYQGDKGYLPTLFLLEEYEPPPGEWASLTLTGSPDKASVGLLRVTCDSDDSTLFLGEFNGGLNPFTALEAWYRTLPVPMIQATEITIADQIVTASLEVEDESDEITDIDEETIIEIVG